MNLFDPSLIGFRFRFSGGLLVTLCCLSLSVIRASWCPGPSIGNAVSGEWRLTGKLIMKGNTFAYNVRLQNAANEVDRTFQVMTSQKWHVHLGCSIYPDLQRVVIDGFANNTDPKMEIYSFEGDLLQTLLLEDVFLEEEMSFPHYECGSRPFRYDEQRHAALEEILNDPHLLLYETHVGRFFTINVEDGSVQELDEEALLPKKPPLDKEEVLQDLRELLKVLPALPQGAVPALYSVRHGAPVQENESHLFHVEGVWVSSPEGGVVNVQGYVEELNGELLIEGGDAAAREAEPYMVLQPLEMDAVLAHAEFLSSLQGDRILGPNMRELRRDHGDALLFAARLLETGHSEAAVKLAAFYLNRYGVVEMEQEVGDALYDHSYRNILRAFQQHQDCPRFVADLTELLNGKRLPLLEKEVSENRDRRRPQGATDPFGEPIQSTDEFGQPFIMVPNEINKSNPFGFSSRKVYLEGPPQPPQPPEPEPHVPFLPGRKWWAGSQLKEVVAEWNVPTEDGLPLAVHAQLTDEADRRLYREWYDKRQWASRAAWWLENNNWLLLPEALARFAVLDSLERDVSGFYGRPDLDMVITNGERDVLQLLKGREELLRILPASLRDPRPVPGVERVIKIETPAKGGAYLKQLYVPKNWSVCMKELMQGIWLREMVNPSWGNEKKKAEESSLWLHRLRSLTLQERAETFVLQSYNWPEEALCILLADPSELKSRVMPDFIGQVTSREDLASLLSLLIAYQLVDREQAVEWIYLLGEQAEPEIRKGLSERWRQDDWKFFEALLDLQLRFATVAGAKTDSPEAIRLVGAEIEHYLSNDQRRHWDHKLLLAAACLISDISFQTLFAEKLQQQPSNMQYECLRLMRRWIHEKGDHSIRWEELRKVTIYDRLACYFRGDAQDAIHAYPVPLKAWEPEAWLPYLVPETDGEVSSFSNHVATAILMDRKQYGDSLEELAAFLSFSSSYYEDHLPLRLMLARKQLSAPVGLQAEDFNFGASVSLERRETIKMLLAMADGAAALDSLRLLPPNEKRYLQQQIAMGQLQAGKALIQEAVRRPWIIERVVSVTAVGEELFSEFEPGSTYHLKEFEQMLEKARLLAVKGDDGMIHIDWIPWTGQVVIEFLPRTPQNSSFEYYQSGVTLRNLNMRIALDRPVVLGEVSAGDGYKLVERSPPTTASELKQAVVDAFTPGNIFNLQRFYILFKPEQPDTDR